MVPLEKVLKKPAPEGAGGFVAPKPRPRTAAAPEPRPPRRFKVVDVMTAEVLAERADAHVTVHVLAGVRSVVDVHVYVWQPKGKKWRLLTMEEQKALWERSRAT
jgi:hypothetical protein